MQDFFDVKVITMADLRTDQEGVFISQLATLICEVFSQSPWNERYSPARIMFGMGIEMMRKNTLLITARHKENDHLIGYVLGQELLVNSEDPRDQTFFKISGAHDLDYLAENNRRTFYVSGLGVSLKYRRCGIAEQLSMTLLKELRQHKFAYRLGRTDLQAHSMRNLYTKQGFKELPIRDVNYPQRSYWLLAL